MLLSVNILQSEIEQTPSGRSATGTIWSRAKPTCCAVDPFYLFRNHQAHFALQNL